ncbi:aminotransferase class V-fold PLP-dependent enzyme [Halobacteriovorax sp. GB3]|uniref:aminotransferase class V-fold PLP-dependent enzyme n=1 Tax=Halobacteriovorax sp. GB3 TaxID=2719615 RepID=UPI002361E9F8|nr:aminotransferase class V-fold PLP-dependent enzyme [Halobacteriovorax sp. GB3]MDD0852323.1 aminotransferase class V-fold PLP-dependent enzyme [Halobacteriovorax sp. GB3]
MFENFNVPNELTPSDPRFGCGPSLLPVEYVQSLLETGPHLLGTSHRKGPFKKIVKEIQEGLKSYFNVPEDYEVVIGNGGATFLFDMIGLGMVDKKITHYTCGEFSSKWFKSSKLIPWIEQKEINVDYGQGVVYEDHSDSDVVAVTLNETSTGVQLDSLPQVNDDQLLAVDATSGAGQVPCDVSKCDIFFFSPQKVFASEGGTFVAILSPKAIARSEKVQEQDRYIPEIMSWKLAIDNNRKHSTYNTPSISTLFFLNEQVKAMNVLGLDRVIELSREKADVLYNWAKEKDYLDLYVKDEKFRSLAVATIDVDDKYPAEDLCKRLADLKIAYGIDAYRKLGRNQFRIALFHNVKKDDLVKLTKIISLAIESN